MKSMRLMKHTFAMALLVSCLFPWAGGAETRPELAAPTRPAQRCQTRPIQDLLAAQGSTVLFFPPVRDMVGWTDLNLINFALVDYAGLADAYLGGALGTSVHGTILECAQSDGRTRVFVNLQTEHALGFAQSIPELILNNFDFLNTPTTFGHKAYEVQAGAAPAVGPARLQLTFFLPYPGAPFSDLRLVLQENLPDLRPITLEFKSMTRGTLPDGTKGRLHVHQVAATDANGVLVFSKEVVDIDAE